jgi:glutamine amidotransferase
MGNLASVSNALLKIGVKSEVFSKPEEIKKYDKVILPGVGAFGDAMKALSKDGLNEAIIEHAKSGKYTLGICLGLALLFDSSEEFGINEGLGLIKGTVKYFSKEQNFKIPHMGWNTIDSNNMRLFNNIENKSYFYFLHSLYVDVQDENVLTSKTNYILDFTSSIEKDNIFGIQPHPEKSHDIGLKVLTNFSLL